MTKRIVSVRRLDERVMMKATARLRSRTLAILFAAQKRSGLSQVQLADTLGVRKSAVNQIWRGNGNLQIDTLGEYLAALGYEADIVVAKVGEFSVARSERRAPRLEALTMADEDRKSDGSDILVVESKSRGKAISNNGNAVQMKQEAEFSWR